MVVKSSILRKRIEYIKLDERKLKKGFYYPLFFIYAFCFTYFFYSAPIKAEKMLLLLFHHHIFTINLLLIVRTFLSLVCKWGRKRNSLPSKEFLAGKALKTFQFPSETWSGNLKLFFFTLLHVENRAKESPRNLKWYHFPPRQLSLTFVQKSVFGW